jgi:hypothetical protein
MSDTEHTHGRHMRWRERSAPAKVFIVVAIIAAIAAIAALISAITMVLWNALLPAIFRLPQIGFWQAAGLVVLAHIFFKGGRGFRAARGPWKRRQVWHHLHEEESGGQQA